MKLWVHVEKIHCQELAAFNTGNCRCGICSIRDIDFLPSSRHEFKYQTQTVMESGYIHKLCIHFLTYLFIISVYSAGCDILLGMRKTRQLIKVDTGVCGGEKGISRVLSACKMRAENPIDCVTQTLYHPFRLGVRGYLTLVFSQWLQES